MPKNIQAFEDQIILDNEKKMSTMLANDAKNPHLHILHAFFLEANFPCCCIHERWKKKFLEQGGDQATTSSKVVNEGNFVGLFPSALLRL